MMKKTPGNRGTTLIELLVVMGLFGMVLAAMMSQYVTLLKTTTATRKIAKTESDVTNVVWPLFKDIESAGFGIPSSGSCTPSVSGTSSDLTIHSTSSGDKKGSGMWSYIGTSCAVSGIPNGDEDAAVVINPVDRSLVASSNVDSTGNVLAGCQSSWTGNIAYWVPYKGALSCYETKFSLKDYTTSYPAPVMCASGTQKVSRSVAYDAGDTNYQPLLDCVLAVNYRFGCINKTSGDLSWRSDSSCSTSEGSLRLVRVGIVLQESPRNDSQGDSSITLFSDLSSASTINLTSTQRYYKWRKIERTIALRNLE